MALTRRGLFRAMGGAVVAGPAVARQAMTSLSGASLAAPAGVALGSWGADPSVPAMPRMLSRAALRTMGIPDWLRQEWRDAARESVAAGRIDPDLESNRAISPVAKRILQRQRNEAKCEEQFFGAYPWDIKRKWFEALGVDGFADDDDDLF